MYADRSYAQAYYWYKVAGRNGRRDTAEVKDNVTSNLPYNDKY
jgi:hypothetical protein